MSGYFHAVAVDYDGTLTAAGPPSADVLDALRRIRQMGLRLLLVTGRILSELRSEFPDLDDHFDMVVAENGAVLHGEGVTRALTAPVSVALDAAMIQRGVSFRRGQVLLACAGEHDVVVLEELRRLGLDCQIARNRDQLMVIPAGVTKGSGTVEALFALGISRHNVIAVGDAENDHALLESCELGIAVANAVPSLKQHADLVLEPPDGVGVASFLSGPLARGELEIETSRWRVELGVGSDGEPVTLPASRINLLIAGGSGSGKSWAAGFLAERLIDLGYTVCIFDLEGDHGPLGRLHNVVLVGGREALPAPAQLARIIQRGFGSVIVDLSLSVRSRDAYISETLAALQKVRTEAGVPHWIIVEEAHGPLGGAGPDGRGLDREHKGFCFVTFRPKDLLSRPGGGIDFLLAMPGEHGIDPELRVSLAEVTGLTPEELGPERTGAGLGQAALIRLGAPPALRVFSLAPRWIEHVRHWHKYAGSRLPPPRRFYFRDARTAVGAAAANLAEFHRELRRCGEGVLRHHASGSDFSRWIQDVIQDSTLAEIARALETRLGRDPSVDVETWRAQLLESIESRYLTPRAARPSAPERRPETDAAPAPAA